MVHGAGQIWKDYSPPNYIWRIWYRSGNVSSVTLLLTVSNVNVVTGTIFLCLHNDYHATDTIFVLCHGNELTVDVYSNDTRPGLQAPI
jgi:hypothetical protein